MYYALIIARIRKNVDNAMQAEDFKKKMLKSQKKGKRKGNK